MVSEWDSMRTENAMTTNQNADATNATIKLDADLTAFLRTVMAGQCLALAAWASQLVRRGEMTTADLERCMNLGFEF